MFEIVRHLSRFSASMVMQMLRLQIVTALIRASEFSHLTTAVVVSQLLQSFCIESTDHTAVPDLERSERLKTVCRKSRAHDRIRSGSESGRQCRAPIARTRAAQHARAVSAAQSARPRKCFALQALPCKFRRVFRGFPRGRNPKGSHCMARALSWLAGGGS